MSSTVKRRIIRALGLLLVCAIIVGGFMGASFINKNSTIKNVSINLNETSAGSFISTKDVQAMLVSNRNIVTGITKVKDLDMDAMERAAMGNPWIDKANVYVGNDRVLYIDIVQKQPVVRLVNGDDVQYYLDANAKVIPLSFEHPVDVPVVTTSTKLNVDSKNAPVLSKAITVASAIVRDTFWNSMISQINITSENEFELIPVLGKHTVLLGDTSLVEEKLAKLKAFYKEACPKVGWDTYTLLDLRHRGQVVASSPTAAGISGVTTTTVANPVTTVASASPKPSVAPTTTMVKTNTPHHATAAHASTAPKPSAPKPAVSIKAPVKAPAKPVAAKAPATKPTAVKPIPSKATVAVKPVVVKQQAPKKNNAVPAKPAPKQAARTIKKDN
jgi:cell division protein FtsQ